MLLGHLPAGYLASTAALARLGVGAVARRRLMAAALVASVAPDLDLLFFYGVDRGVHHHAFVTHWPVLWVGLAASGALLGAVLGRRLWVLGALVVGAGGLLHLALDSIAGEVRWLAPWSVASVTLAEVPPRFDSWILSFVAHWTFGVELALVAFGLIVWRRKRAPRR